MVPDSRDVALTIPAQPGYLVLARLALSAICRLTPLGADVVADLKLAVSEAAADFVSEAGDPDRTVEFSFRLEPAELVIVLAGSHTAEPPSEQDLGRAIIEATVDRAEFEEGRTLLVKSLDAGG